MSPRTVSKKRLTASQNQARLPPPGCRHPAAATRLPPPGCRHPAAATRLPPPGCRHPAAATRLPPPGCRHPAAATRLPPPGCRKGARVTASSEPAPPFPVVGIGASAGGLEAFTQLLSCLPADTGMAFVLIQHLDPQHDSLLTQALSRATTMPVVQISDGMEVECNHVYVIPPNADAAILHGALTLLPRTMIRAGRTCRSTSSSARSRPTSAVRPSPSSCRAPPPTVPRA